MFLFSAFFDILVQNTNYLCGGPAFPQIQIMVFVYAICCSIVDDMIKLWGNILLAFHKLRQILGRYINKLQEN